MDKAVQVLPALVEFYLPRTNYISSVYYVYLCSELSIHDPDEKSTWLITTQNLNCLTSHRADYKPI